MSLLISKRHPLAKPVEPEKDLDTKVDDLIGVLEETGAYLKIMLNCRRCDRRYEFGGNFEDLKNFDEYYNLCGGSDRCIP